MNTTDHAMLLEWLDLDLEGQLGGAEKTALEAKLAGDDTLARKLRVERRQLGALHEAFEEDRIPVREGFHDEVMASLPHAAWERRRMSVWALPMAAALVLSLGAVFLLGTTGLAESHVVGTGLAVLELLQVTTLAGAGLLDASWRGLGLGLGELFSASKLGLAAMVAFIVCLDLLFLSLLRRRSPATAESEPTNDVS